MKYPISKEFFPFNHFTPPFRSAKFAGRIGGLMKPPCSIWHDKKVKATRQYIKSFDGQDVELIVFEPEGIKDNCACLVYFHGGGFFIGAAWYHYKLVRQYALDTPCKAVFVQYRLTPKHPHPTPSEDCYAALKWTFDNADSLNVDSTKIAVGGDSAGGALAAAVCQMARDRKTALPLFQLLVYPVTDRRMETDSQKTYPDTPMWNGKLSRIMWQGYVQGNEDNIAYASPMEAESFADLPQAYVETAEFDCLRDEGEAYADALKKAGVDVQLNQTKGTMHGFDIKRKAPTTVQTVSERIEYMKRAFGLI
ncbi:MAG: alpha/beta hydrolase [Candidatus Coproplasma sp.]